METCSGYFFCYIICTYGLFDRVSSIFRTWIFANESLRRDAKKGLEIVEGLVGGQKALPEIGGLSLEAIVGEGEE
jgi:hypothetical protein